ncbi:hypothetical protein FACS189492_2280 [Clostridia bacterium]|nr:hypothetical protein FACS189492_2280 [Clostridia bacterium]
MEKYEAYLPEIDVNTGMNRLMNNKKLYFTMLKSFLNGKMGHELQAAIVGDDLTKTSQTAHAVKGVAANLGLTELWNLSAEIEAAAKAQQPTAAFADRLKATVDATEGGVQSLLENDKD